MDVEAKPQTATIHLGGGYTKPVNSPKARTSFFFKGPTLSRKKKLKNCPKITT